MSASKYQFSVSHLLKQDGFVCRFVKISLTAGLLYVLEWFQAIFLFDASLWVVLSYYDGALPILIPCTYNCQRRDPSSSKKGNYVVTAWWAFNPDVKPEVAAAPVTGPVPGATCLQLWIRLRLLEPLGN